MSDAPWSALELASLHHAGLSSRMLRSVLETYPSPERYRAAAGEDLPLLPERSALSGLLPMGVEVCMLGDDRYPSQLAASPSPPLLLYVRGSFAALRSGIAVVGTREVSALGEVVASLAVSVAAELGVPVSSGLARGVDAVAAREALSRGAQTVGVLASGVCHPMPKGNVSLADEVLAAGGALVSEQLPGYDPAAVSEGRRYAGLLQARNRIVAGLASVLVPAEASLRSGTCGAVWAMLASGRPVVVARPRPAAAALPGAALPLFLADPSPRTEGELRSVGMSAALAKEWAGRGRLAAGVGEDREMFAALLATSYRLSPWS